VGQFREWGAIFCAGSDAEHFYLIDEGSVSLEMFVRGTGSSHYSDYPIGAGEALGWSWLFPPYRWHFSARSHGVTDAVAFDARVLRQYAEANHGYGYELAMRVGQVMLQRLQATREQLVHFYDAIKEC
jgi:CRP/FNR family cyclic AMP-dependent transcriptional regulator